MRSTQDAARRPSSASRALTAYLVSDDDFLIEALARLIIIKRPTWSVERIATLSELYQRLKQAPSNSVVFADASATSDLGSRAIALARGCYPHLPTVAYVDGFGSIDTRAMLAHRLVGGSVPVQLVLRTIEHALAPEGGTADTSVLH